MDPNLINLVDQVSCKEVISYGNGETRILLIDCGVKGVDLIRHFLKRGVTLIRVPWDYDFSAEEYDGLFIRMVPEIRRCARRRSGICR